MVTTEKKPSVTIFKGKEITAKIGLRRANKSVKQNPARIKAIIPPVMLIPEITWESKKSDRALMNVFLINAFIYLS